MSALLIATLISLFAVSLATAAELGKLVEERPRGLKEWSVGLVDAWTKAQIVYLKNLHWVLLAMMCSGVLWSNFGPADPQPYPFNGVR